MQSNHRTRYTDVAIVLHWMVSSLVIANILMAWGFDHWPDPYAQAVTDTHKSFGIIVLGLALMRILWRLAHQPPDLPTHIPRWQRSGIRAVHIALYVMIVAMPLSGWLYDSAWKDAPSNPIHFFGLFDFPRIGWVAHMADAPKEKLDGFFGATHVWLSYALYALVGLHIAGALKRQFLDGEPELQRMLFRDRNSR
jgi:cytochrome b561